MYISDYMYAAGYFESSNTSYGAAKNFGNQNRIYKGGEGTFENPYTIAMD